MGNFLSNCQGSKFQVVSRTDGTPVVEKVPFVIRFQLAVLFSTWLGRIMVRMDFMRQYLIDLTVELGRKYDAPGSDAAIPKFVADYAVDCTELDRPIGEYKTLNEFFYRTLKAGSRPIHAAGEEAAAVQPCDCRLNVFPDAASAARLWIKGRGFSLGKLMGNVWGEDELQGASIVLCRLAPNDYHRFHSPVAGRVTRITDLGRALYTVKPVAVSGMVDVLGENKRLVVEIDSPTFGPVAYVAVGATHVGSIGLSVEVGDNVVKGGEVGWFAYGGSTVVVVFRGGAVELDGDLLENSSRGVETLVRMGESLGRRP